MIDFLGPQIIGAVAGGLVGGCSGFIANTISERRQASRVRSNLGGALIGEIEALRLLIERGYIETLRAELEAVERRHIRHYHRFRGERDYMPVFRSLGRDIGLLPNPLPSDLVFWYASVALCLERAHTLHELALHRPPDWTELVVEVSELQLNELLALVENAKPLLQKLSSI